MAEYRCNAFVRAGSFIRGRARVALSIGLVLVASCGDTSPNGPNEKISQPTCSPATYAPCVQNIDVGGVCTLFPDYKSCAGSPDLSNPTPFLKQIEFLWLGEGAPQALYVGSSGACSYGVCPTGYYCGAGARCYAETLDPARVSVLHGSVENNGAGVPGVWVKSVADTTFGLVTTEWGYVDPVSGPPQTPTGQYFMAVNAGQPIRLQFSKEGYLPTERVVTPIAGEYVLVPAVELVRLEFRRNARFDRLVGPRGHGAPNRVKRARQVAIFRRA